MAQGNLGVLFNNLRGKAGSVVFARSKDGTVIKPRVTGKNPKPPAQLAVRSALTKSSQTYKSLPPAQVAAWQTYSTTIAKRDIRTSKPYVPNAINAFGALTTKFYQINPPGTALLTPPAAAFPGDTVVIQASGGPGAVTFTALTANAANVKTELLLQKLASRNRTPQPKGYRSKGFVAFAGSSLTSAVPTPASWYAAAYRFVNMQTGQATALVPLGLVQVV